MTSGADEWARLGAAFRELEQYDDALLAFGVSLTLDPDCAETWHAAGVVLTFLRRDDEARTVFLRALALDPRHARARFNLATLLHQEGSADAPIHLAVLYRYDPELAALLRGQVMPREGG